MPLWARGWPEALKARAARYALQRWLGPFLEEPLRLEQLGLDLRGGTGSLRELRLRAAALDALLAEAAAPLELLEGALGAVTVTVPWAALGTEPVRLRLSGLRLVLRPRQPGSPRSGSPPPGGSQQGRDPPPEPPPLEGLEALALTIDTVLRRLQVLLEDAELRVELPPQPGGGPGGALELHLPRAEYEDAGGDPGSGPPAVLLKELRLRDVRLLWQELPPPWAQVPVSPPVLGGLLPGPSELSLRLKQKRSEGLPGAAVELEGRVGSLHLLLPPPLLGTLRALLGALDPPAAPPGGRSRPLGPQDLALIERELSRALRGGGNPPSPPGGDPDSELFYSMTGSLGGGAAPGTAAPPPTAPPPQAGVPPPGGGSGSRSLWGRSPRSCPSWGGRPAPPTSACGRSSARATPTRPGTTPCPSPTSGSRPQGRCCRCSRGARGGPGGGSLSPAWSCWRSCRGRSQPGRRSCISPPPRPPVPPPPSPCCACAGAPPAPPPPGPRPCPRAPRPPWSWGCS